MPAGGTELAEGFYNLMYVKNSTLKHDVEIMLKTLWMTINGREVGKL